MIYLDTSALTKLLVNETETPDLRVWLTEHRTSTGGHVATSALGRVELMRVAMRYNPSGQVERARHLLDGVDVIPLSERVITRAESIGPPNLRSSDAIHLAAAAELERELIAFVTYDHRLLDGCREVGLPTACPGATH